MLNIFRLLLGLSKLKTLGSYNKHAFACDAIILSEAYEKKIKQRNNINSINITKTDFRIPKKV